MYERFFQPSVRGGTQGSKKRYAGLVNGELHVVGLEAVRRDWPELARRLQRGMLERLFRDEPVAPFVNEVVADLLAGGLDRELVIRKALRKGAVDRYTGPTPPHVEAARKAGAGNRARRASTCRRAPGRSPSSPTASCRRTSTARTTSTRSCARSRTWCSRQIGLDFDEVTDAPRQLTLL